MAFLQPLLLFGLPLISLPILIHLINRQRHRTKPWAAMMFLLSAKRMTRGMARLRHILIMAMRMLAVAGLVLAISRPLASGWLGLAAGGRPATVMILLDRSVSMEQQELQNGVSKRTRGLQKLVELVKTLGTGTRVVLIESTEGKAREIENPSELLELPETTATASGADIPAMLQEAAEYIAINQAGRTDVWVCSDLRRSDWDDESGRWETLRQTMGPLAGVRFQLLSYTSAPQANLAVRVEGVRRRSLEQSAELVFDVHIQRQDASTQPLQVPVAFVINGARSVLDVELVEQDFHLQGHVIPVDKQTESGWGRVELPGDSNPQDNAYYFVFGPQPEHRTVVVSDDSQSSEPLRLAARTPVDPAVTHTAEVLPSSRAGEIEWEKTAMVLWQAPLPDGATAAQLEQFVRSGRSVIFFPPEIPGREQLFGARWGDWREVQQGTPLGVGNWRDDSGLLRNTLSGQSLPVGDLKTYRYCGLESDGNVLARFEGGDPLLAQAGTDAGGAYFCSTLPRTSHSSLARDGVVFYVMLHRALADGAASLGNIKQLTAGEGKWDSSQWEPETTGQEVVLTSARPYHAGVYTSGEQWLALNRPDSEDRLATLSEDKLAELFSGLDYYIVKDQVDNTAALASEIWKSFLIIMAMALLLEAVLCVPTRKEEQTVDLGTPTESTRSFHQTVGA